MSWSREQCELLIEQYQRFQCLYAVKSTLYKNKHARQAALEKIQNALKSVKPNVTIPEIKAKWNGLRTNFLTEYRKWNASKNHSGAAEDAVYKPTIWYFEKCFFILDHVRVRSSIDSLGEATPEGEIDEDGSQDSQAVLLEGPDDSDQFSGEVSENYVLTTEGFLEPEKRNRPSSTESRAESSQQDCGTPSKQRKKEKKKGPSEENDIIKEATNALTVISEHMVTKSSGNINKNAAMANFIVAKLDEIDDDEVRLDVEQEITLKLYEGIKRSRERKQH